MNTSLPSPTNLSGRALVLGGGGSAGNAWLIGVIAGLSEGGVDASAADLVVGTSAGATAAAQIAGEAIARLFEQTVAPIPAVAGRPATRPTLTRDHLERTDAVIAASSDPADMRRRMGVELATDAMSSDAGTARWRGIVAARFSRHEWPEKQDLLITAVDADTGEPVVFDRDSGVRLVDAVAASTAGGFAYRIGDRRYIDGGYRSNAENADLAAGCEKVLVLSPFGGRTRLPLEWRLDLAHQIDDLRAQGSVVEEIHPDQASLDAFGDNVMNPMTRPPAARAGYNLGLALAPRLAGFWSVVEPVG
ncbi:patatin-like phospholipase family protein [Microbacterium sp. AZCO]|uniref:patatin-like phospholipase family protein n=1 Tax=Microbacterium sp. AZCO TaxID=3142976 RepID=UPI0031F41887